MLHIKKYNIGHTIKVRTHTNKAYVSKNNVGSTYHIGALEL